MDRWPPAISTQPIFFTFVLAWIAVSCIRGYLLRRRMPPGPLGFPIIGNVFQMPTSLPWLRFLDTSKIYNSPVVSFVAAGQPVVVLNDHKSAYELLDKRSSNYSHRPRFIMAGELLCNAIMLTFISYNDLYRRMRRASHETFGPHGAERFQSLQEQEAVRLAVEILGDPDNWDATIKRSTASNILTATYGWPRINDDYNPLVKRIHEHTARLASACIPGSSMVDLFPILNYLPPSLAKFKRDALSWHEKESQMFENMFNDVKKNAVVGKAKDSFVVSLIEEQKRHTLSLKEAAWLAGLMFSGGSETTTASVAAFLLAMVHYPEVMRKSQEQIDRVVGRDRVPTFADRPHLPYIRAVVKELLRWRPPGPLGIPRRSAEDDWFDGYFIPKGSTVISNIWAINRDPNVYHDAENFIPERYLDETETIDVNPPDMHSLGHSTFGFGRRSCVGVAFANQSLFADIAVLLWAFDITKASDEEGNEITPSLTDVIDCGATVRPAPFVCKLSPRFPEVASVLAYTLATY